MIIVLFLVSLQQTQKNVEAGPVAAMSCILTCTGTSCASASVLCKYNFDFSYVHIMQIISSFQHIGLPLGAAFGGPAAVLAAAPCLMLSGGSCAACITVCTTVVLPAPTP